MRKLALHPHAPSSAQRMSLVDIICNRCGDEVAQQQRLRDVLDVPGMFRADFVTERGEEYKADLCALCTKEVIDFINEGTGPGVQLLRYGGTHVTA
jgi:hypothetical protein